MKNKISKLLSTLLLFIVTANVNAACRNLVHQPEIPESALKLSNLD